MGYRLLHVDVSCDQPLRFSADACLIACNTVPTSVVESVRIPGGSGLSNKPRGWRVSRSCIIASGNDMDEAHDRFVN
jgi:hypothetical protein